MVSKEPVEGQAHSGIGRSIAAADLPALEQNPGWPATLANFKPEIQRKADATIGDLLNELRGHWPGKQKTFEDYCRSIIKSSNFAAFGSVIFSMLNSADKES